MSLISLKRSKKHVVNMNISFEMAFFLGGIEAYWRHKRLGPFVVTSAKDGKHRKGSFHKQDKPDNIKGEGTDIRTRHLFKRKKYDPRLLDLIKWLQETYGPHGLRIFLHGYHDKGVPHLHLSYDEKKGKLWRWVK